MTSVIDAPLWMRVLGGVFLLFGVAFVAVAVMSVTNSWPGAIGLAFGAIAMFAGGVLLLLSRITVTLDSDACKLAYRPLWNKRIALEDIESVHVSNVGFMTYGGVGLRWTPGTLALLFNGGDVVEIVLHNGRRYVAQVDDPHRYAAAIDELIPRT